MEIKQDWVIPLNAAQFLDAQPDSFVRLLNSPKMRATFDQAVEEVRQALEPRACWERFPIRAIRHDKVVLADGTRLGGGPLVRVVAGAQELVLAVCTIGAQPDALIAAARRANQWFKMTLFHELSAWAVGLLRQELCHHLARVFQAEGLRVSAPLSPGESEWPVTDQKVIFALLDATQIGVSLNDSMMMQPIWSLSLALGCGRHAMGVEEASNCAFCTIQERCRYRAYVAAQRAEGKG
ncbi:MAG: hypothetical protein NZ765_11920 [Anaerolineae bacterium]|nr:hypothetical protein [Anaerolineae bacterium]MDW8072324.1 hypothetical protein [Anaerolineae bacterium]